MSITLLQNKADYPKYWSILIARMTNDKMESKFPPPTIEIKFIPNLR